MEFGMFHQVHARVCLTIILRWWPFGSSSYPICSMVLEYLPTFARTKSPSHVGKYTSTMVRIWVLFTKFWKIQIYIQDGQRARRRIAWRSKLQAGLRLRNWALVAVRSFHHPFAKSIVGYRPEQGQYANMPRTSQDNFLVGMVFWKERWCFIWSSFASNYGLY